MRFIKNVLMLFLTALMILVLYKNYETQMNTKEPVVDVLPGDNEPEEDNPTVDDLEFKDSIVELNNNSLTNYISNEITTIKRYLFYENTNLISVSMPNAISIEQNAFEKCGNLKNVNLENVAYIGENAFKDCTSLSTINLEKATNIGAYVFQNCINLENVNISSANAIYAYTFQNCTNLKNVIAPNAQLVNDYAFENCTNLEEIELNNVLSLGMYVFNGCENLKRIYLNNLEIIWEYSFKNCNSLSEIYLCHNGVVSLVDVNVFDGIENKITIYTEEHYLEDYKTADNWSELYNDGKIEFVAVSNSNTDSLPEEEENLVLSSLGIFDNTPYTSIAYTIKYEEGMTWEQWVESEYNTIGAIFHGSNILVGENKVIYGTSDPVLKSSIIGESFRYRLREL